VIRVSTTFDLGRDKQRMKNPADAARQTRTADEILRRLFHDNANERWEHQILADEVGMGKTFVALAVAFSLLEQMLAGNEPADLAGCYQKVVILTPGNSSLFAKWYREVSEFVKRCVDDSRRAEVEAWFKPISCDRLDHFVASLRRRGNSSRVVLAPMDIFADRKLRNYDAKRRFLLAALFRYWGNRLQFDRRERLLKGAPEDWPHRPEELSAVECDEIPCSESEALDAIGRLDRAGENGSDSPVEALLADCRAISDPYVRDRVELFAGVAKKLAGLYKEMVLLLLGSAVPLVIVDEAHNWKNGPEHDTHGYCFFRKYLASRTRRALLLTATPFQLRPQEMLELVRIGEDLQPAPERSGAQARRDRIAALRTEVLSPVLERADLASRRFSKAWSKLTGKESADVAQLWTSAELVNARLKIESLAQIRGKLPERRLDELVAATTSTLDPALRGFFAEALRLYAFNRDVSHELGTIVIRHRRATDHRAFRVGCEYSSNLGAADERPDRHLLHGASGIDVSGEAELPHYLLMRCVSDTKGGKGRSSLGTALTGCYSTLLASAEGRRVREWLEEQPTASGHFRLLLEMVNKRSDPRHPKLASVVEQVVQTWQNGEKTLLFCFRTNTAERLHEIILQRIDRELGERRRKCLGGEAAFKSLRGRITRRDGDLMPLCVDRVLWSLAASNGFERGWSYSVEDLVLQDDDLAALARVCLIHGIDVSEERVDRVFVTRAIEHVIARRLLRSRGVGPAREVLARVAEPAWVEWPYGLSQAGRDDDVDREGEGFDTRGVHTRYPVEKPEPLIAEVAKLTERIRSRRTRAHAAQDTSVFDADADAPSLWFGGPPRTAVAHVSDLVRQIHVHLARLTEGEDDTGWESRRAVLESLRRAFLRESVLVRLLPTKTARHERTWGELLVEAFWKPSNAGQLESMADRIEVFLEDLCGASGTTGDKRSARGGLLDATRLRDQKFVALVKGGDQKTRERVFAGFNTPLLPDVLVCTSVGAEGIDLHRHCRHVVHYDLAWNPAVLEQRTGRIDRIGSKTFRERKISSEGKRVFLEVGVPFLAGTYDERMYEELRQRAQVFEVLTGGDLAGDGGDSNLEGRDDGTQAEGKEQSLGLVQLPTEMVEDLRVRLSVWHPEQLPPP
jgi:hypothetical protein